MKKLGTQKDIINIDGETNFVRDKNSKAILSNNSEGLKAYKLTSFLLRPKKSIRANLRSYSV